MVLQNHVIHVLMEKKILQFPFCMYSKPNAVALYV